MGVLHFAFVPFFDGRPVQFAGSQASAFSHFLTFVCYILIPHIFFTAVYRYVASYFHLSVSLCQRCAVLSRSYWSFSCLFGVCMGVFFFTWEFFGDFSLFHFSISYCFLSFPFPMDDCRFACIFLFLFSPIITWSSFGLDEFSFLEIYIWEGRYLQYIFWLC